MADGATVREQLLMAASAASAALTSLIERARDEDAADLGAALWSEEVDKNLADALQTVLDLTAFQGEEAELANQLTGSLTRFLEGWA